MPVKTVAVNCKNCGRVAGSKRTPNHWIHFFLSILTGGVWLLVWLFVSVWNRIAGASRCSLCGGVSRQTG